MCSSQTSPIAAPHVVQGTDNICFEVSSLVFTSTSCNALSLEKCPILLILSKLDRAAGVILGTPVIFPGVSKSEHLWSS